MCSWGGLWAVSHLASPLMGFVRPAKFAVSLLCFSLLLKPESDVSILLRDDA